LSQGVEENEHKVLLLQALLLLPLQLPATNTV
jgi:hypothetical protein